MLDDDSKCCEGNHALVLSFLFHGSFLSAPPMVVPFLIFMRPPFPTSTIFNDLLCLLHFHLPHHHPRDCCYPYSTTARHLRKDLLLHGDSRVSETKPRKNRIVLLCLPNPCSRDGWWCSVPTFPRRKSICSATSSKHAILRVQALLIRWVVLMYRVVISDMTRSIQKLTICEYESRNSTTMNAGRLCATINMKWIERHSADCRVEIGRTYGNLYIRKTETEYTHYQMMK